jgi:predicted transposase YdaD
MSKKKKASGPESLDINHFIHQPHDKYVRAILQSKVIVVQIIEFVVPKSIFALLDLRTLKLTNASFINEQLQINLADICYEGKTKTGKPFRICLLFEHKSDGSVVVVYEQLNRYIANVWVEDRKQDRALTLSIPILIAHGSTPVVKESPVTLFPDAPEELLRFVPLFDYLILDTALLTEETIVNLKFLALRNVLLALKYSRDENYLRENWKKVIIFATKFKTDKSYFFVIQSTITYMVSISKTVQQNLSNIDNVLTSNEQEMVRPFFLQKYIQEGLMIAIRSFMKKNPDMEIKQVADLFDVDIELVEQSKLLS